MASVIGLALGVLLSTPAAKADPAPPDDTHWAQQVELAFPAPEPELDSRRTDQQSAPAWEIALQDISAAIAPHLDSNFAAMEVTADQYVLMIYTKDLQGDGVEELRSIFKEYGEEYFELVEVPFSEGELLKAQARVTAGDVGALGGVTPAATGFDYRNGRMRLQFDVRDVTRVTSTQIQQVGGSGDSVDLVQVAREIGVPVTFSIESVPDATLADGRLDDDAPFTSGGAIVSTWSDGYGGAPHGKVDTARCSTALCVKHQGRWAMVTAGHCGNMSNYADSGRYRTGHGLSVGSTMTTTYPTNAHIYGDWQLIRGGSYELSAFTGALSSGTQMNIRGWNYVDRPINSYLCSTGSTTGFKCRYKVLYTNTSRVFGWSNDQNLWIVLGEVTCMAYLPEDDLRQEEV